MKAISLIQCAVLVFLAAGATDCASPASVGTSDLAVAIVSDLSTVDSSPDLTKPDGAVGPCTLGDPDHCGTCATVCPPGMDTASTLRTCSAATAFGLCGYACRGEYYEIDGKTANGCEAEDLPVQDSASSAVTLTLADGAKQPSPAPDNANPINVVGRIYGDTRDHESAPTARPNGRDDWFKVMVTGSGSAVGIGACLGITNFPTDNTFEVCLSGKNATGFTVPGCKEVTGGAASTCVTQDNSTDGSGTYYIRIRRVSGATYTANGYALYLEH